MSTFMCKPATIGAIADYIWNERDNLFKDLYTTGSDKDGLYTPKLNGDPCDRDDIYKRLWNMNAHALTIRYTDHAVTEMVGEYELYPAMPVRNDGVLAKKFDCFMYQCAEGDIPKSYAYFEVKCALISIMTFITRTTKEYQEAAWG